MKRARDIIIARLVQLPRILALAQSFGVSSHLSCGPQRSKNYIHNIPLEQRGYSDVTRPFLSVKGLAPQTNIQNALLILPCTMSIVVVVVSSEQVIKPCSKQAVVKPEALHLFECQLHVLELY